MAEPEPEPPRSRLRQLLERPEARPRVSRAVASLLATAVVAIAAVGGLLIWHLIRRGRLIRAGLNPPRPVRWPAIARPDRRAPTSPTDETETPRREP
jgi:hypothetical protein